MKKNIFAILLSVISVFVLYLLFTKPLSSLISPIQAFGISGAFLAYLIAGIIVGWLVKKTPLLPAIFAGVLSWAVYPVMEKISLFHYGISSDFLFSNFEQTFFLNSLISMILLFGVGGLLGRRMQTFFSYEGYEK